jgi:transposase InsO family protein
VTQFWSNADPGRFANFCMNNGIEHILRSNGEPTTQRRIERFFQIFELYYSRFNDLDRLREAYNHKLNRMFNYKTPAEIYFN